jgi:hypothetical protein
MHIHHLYLLYVEDENYDDFVEHYYLYVRFQLYLNLRYLMMINHWKMRMNDVLIGLIMKENLNHHLFSEKEKNDFILFYFKINPNFNEII